MKQMAIAHSKLEQWFSTAALPAVPERDDGPMQEIRIKSLALAKAIVSNTPPSADQSAAIRKVREAMASSAQAIVCK